MIRVGVALFLFAAAGFVIVRFSGRRKTAVSARQLTLLGRLPLGRETVYAVRCGPDVVVFVSGPAGMRVLGRWPEDRWNGEGIDEADT